MGIYVEAQTAINQRHIEEAELVQLARQAEAATAAAAAAATLAADNSTIQPTTTTDVVI